MNGGTGAEGVNVANTKQVEAPVRDTVTVRPYKVMATLRVPVGAHATSYPRFGTGTTLVGARGVVGLGGT